MSSADEKFTAKFDETLVDPPTEKYNKPVIAENPVVIEKVAPQPPLTVKKKKAICSIQ